MHETSGPSEQDRPSLEALTRGIVDSYQTGLRAEHIDATFLPSRDAAIGLLGLLHELVFPGFIGEQKLTSVNLLDHVGSIVAQVRESLEGQVDAALRYSRNLERDGQGDDCARCTELARRVTDVFLTRVPEIRRLLSLDVQAAYDGDPACRNTDEAIFCYPGVYAIFVHRVAHELFASDVPLIPRIMNEHAHSKTGIDIHPGATIGESFFIDHGTGVVIGETAEIGARVKLYQGVTLGGKADALTQAGRGKKRHPTLEDDVVIYANATLLGGDTVVGAGSVIGGGVFLTASVPAGHFVYNKPQDLKYRSAEKLKAVQAATLNG